MTQQHCPRCLTLLKESSLLFTLTIKKHKGQKPLTENHETLLCVECATAIFFFEG